MGTAPPDDVRRGAVSTIRAVTTKELGVDEGANGRLAELRETYLRHPRVPEESWSVIDRWHHLRDLDTSDLPERCVEWWHMSLEAGWIQNAWASEQVSGLLRGARREATRPITGYHCRVHVWSVIQALLLCGSYADLELALDLADRAAPLKGHCMGSGDMEEDAGRAFDLIGFADAAVMRAVRGAGDMETVRSVAVARRPTQIGAFDEGVARGISRVSEELGDWPEVTEADRCLETAGLDAFDLESLRRWTAARWESPHARVRRATWWLLSAGDPGTSDVPPEAITLAWSDVRSASDDEVIAEAGHYLWSQLPDTRAEVTDEILSRVPGLTPRRVLDRTWSLTWAGFDPGPHRWLRFHDAVLPAYRRARGDLRDEARGHLRSWQAPAPEVDSETRPYRDAVWSRYGDPDVVSARKVWHEPDQVRGSLERHLAFLADAAPTPRLRPWYWRDARLAQAWLRVVGLREEQPAADPDDIVSRRSDRMEDRTLEFLAAFIREFGNLPGPV
jgi:hypothetical protein